MKKRYFKLIKTIKDELKILSPCKRKIGIRFDLQLGRDCKVLASKSHKESKPNTQTMKLSISSRLNKQKNKSNITRDITLLDYNFNDPLQKLHAKTSGIIFSYVNSKER